MLRVLILVAVGSVLLTGCSGQDEPAEQSAPASASPSAGPATTSSRPDPHAAFNPCTALKPEWRARYGFEAEARPQERDDNGEISRIGCSFYKKDETYNIGVYSIRSYTLEGVRAVGFRDLRDFAIGGRKGLTHRSATRESSGDCVADIEIKGGLVEILLNKTDYRELIPGKDPCDLVREVSQWVVKEIPATA